MNRETKTIQIGKYLVEHKTYATPREVNVLRDSGFVEGSSNTSKQEIALIDQLVVSLKKDGVLIEEKPISEFVLDNFEFANEYVVLITSLGDVLAKKK